MSRSRPSPRNGGHRSDSLSAAAASAGARTHQRAVHDVHAAEWPDGDPARGSQRADRQRERLVSRRLGQREAGPHRIRASLRAPDVRGIRPREGRRLRQPPRGRRRQQQRLDRRRPHQLLHRHAVERARPRAVPRVRSHGLPARHRLARISSTASATSSRTSAARATRTRRTAWRSVRIPELHLSEESSVPLAGHRLHGRPDRGLGRRRARVLQEVLRAAERQPGRSPATSTPPKRRKRIEHWFADVKPGKPADADRGAAGRAHQRHQGDADRPGAVAAAVSRRGSRRPFYAPGDAELDVVGERALRAARTRGSTSGSSTTCSSRRTSRASQASKQLGSIFQIIVTARPSTDAARADARAAQGDRRRGAAEAARRAAGRPRSRSASINRSRRRSSAGWRTSAGSAARPTS